METSEDVKPARRRSRRIAWILWCVLGFVLLLVLGNVGFVVFDVNRSVEPPVQESRSLTITIVASSPNANPTTETVVAVIVSESDRNTSISMNLDGFFVKPVENDRFQLNAKIEKINAAYRKTMMDFAAYIKDEPGLSRNEARERLYRIHNDWWKSFREDYLNSSLYGTYATPESHQYASNKIDEINNIFCCLNLKLAVKYQDWFSAANVCMEARYGWPAEVYYYQKMGARGKAIILERRSRRYWHCLKSSLMSIGPDFHWPRLEDE